MSGEFRLHALPVGTLPVPSWAALFGTTRQGRVDLGFYVWVITDGTTLGLVDLGLPLDPKDAAALDRANQGIDDESYFHSPRLLPDVLSAAGVDGSDVDFVLITQTVTYHTGGLDAQQLPRAEFYLAYQGIREMLVDRPGHPATEFYFTGSSWASLRELMIQDRVHLVDGPTEVVPGVVFEPTGGHHPGSAAVRVRTHAGWTGILETAFLQENLDQVRPIGIAEDIATCRAVIRRYLAECDEVVAIHDPSNATRFPVDNFRAPSSRRTNT